MATTSKPKPPKQYECPYCNFKTTSKITLSNHKLTCSYNPKNRKKK